MLNEPNKHQVHNLLELGNDSIYLTTDRFVLDDAGVVFRFVLEQVWLNRLFHNPLYLQSFTWFY